MNAVLLPFSPSRRSLGPEDLHRAAEAFELALHVLDEKTSMLNPYSTRQTLARLVIGRALSGEHDPIRMCTDAIEELRRISFRERPPA